MVVTTRPLKIKYKKLANPFQEFMQISPNNNALTKEVVFLRYIGIPDSVDLYKEDILKWMSISQSKAYFIYDYIGLRSSIIRKMQIDCRSFGKIGRLLLIVCNYCMRHLYAVN